MLGRFTDIPLRCLASWQLPVSQPARGTGRNWLRLRRAHRRGGLGGGRWGRRGGESRVGGVAGAEAGATAWTEAVAAWVTKGGVAFEGVEGVAFARLADDFCLWVTLFLRVPRS